MVLKPRNRRPIIAFTADLRYKPGRAANKEANRVKRAYGDSAMKSDF